MIFFFDTETNGKAEFKLPFTSPLQPELVQLAGILDTLDRRTVGQINFIIEPEGWTIPEEVTKIHGISEEMAKAYGVPRRTALSAFNNMCRKATTISAHNLNFDRMIMQTACHRAGAPDRVAPLRQICTMEASTDLCKLPGRFGNFKWPKLIEVHHNLFGECFEGAHNAMVDVIALRRVFWELVDREVIQL